MLMLVSPAKTLDYETECPVKDFSEAELLDYSQRLIDEIKLLSPQDVASLMSLSDQLAHLNVLRFQQWQKPFNLENARQAIYAFKGDVYTGLDAYSLTSKEMVYAQQHLRILSGLYGLLRPLDLMQPYRLEMGTKFANSSGKNLYEFWGDVITDQINSLTEADDIILNLASNEYFKAVNQKKTKGNVITPVFKDQKNGQFKIISFYAKKARGMMAAYVIKNQIDSIDGVKGFDVAGYQFKPEMSKKNELVFTREEQGA